MKIYNRGLQVSGELRKVGTPVVRVFTSDATGNVTRASGATVPTDADKGYAKGCLFSQTDGVVGSVLYINEGTAASADFNALGAGGGGSTSLNGAYETGRTIEVDTGAIVITDAQTGATDTFDIDKTGTGSGDIFDIKLEDAFTGRIMYMDMDDALSAKAILIDSGGTARTGSDIVFTDDSTGNHSLLDLNKSGAGASVGLDYTDTHAGSSSSFGAKITTGNDNGLSTTGIQIVRGTGARTAPAIDINDDSTGNVALIDIDLATGVYTGDVINVGLAAAATTGYVLNIDLNAGVAYGAIKLDAGNAVRTEDLIDVVFDGSGNVSLLDVNNTNTGSGNVIDIAVTGVHTGHQIAISHPSAASTGDALNVSMGTNVAGGAVVITGAGARTDSLIDVVSSETGSQDGMVLLQTTGVFTGHMLTVHSDGAATTGGLVHLDLDAGVAYKAVTLDLAGARTVEAVLVTFDGTFGSGAGGTFLNADITMSGASASPFIDIDVTGVYTGAIFDVALGAAATNNVINIDLDAGLAATALRIDSGAGTRTQPVIELLMEGDGTGAGGTLFDIDVNESGATSNPLFDITLATGVYAGNVFDVGVDVAATGNVINIDMNLGVAATAIRLDAGAVTRTQPLMETIFDGAGDTIGGTLWDIDVTNTGATASPLFDIDVTGVYTGNIFDVVFGNASASTGDALHVDMGTNLAGNAIQIDAAGTRTAPLINIANTGADGGLDDHVILITQSGILDSNLIQLTFVTAASTGNGIAINMGAAASANVAGMALTITSAGTGVTAEGSAINVDHSGILVAGADVVSIKSTGAISSTSNALAIATIGDAGSYALYIDATGSAEAIHVDTGTVLFDETLTVTGATTLTGAATLSSTLAVTGATTLSSTLSYRNLTEVVTGTNTILAAESGTVFFLNAAGGFTSTLPAVAAGLYFSFIVQTAPTTAYIIATDGGADVIVITVNELETDTTEDGPSDDDADTVNFVANIALPGDRIDFMCNGTKWYAMGQVRADGAVTTATT